MILGNNNIVTAEALLVQPVNLTVDIVRNLSASWYHKHPDVEIAGILDAFAVSEIINTSKASAVFVSVISNSQKGRADF